MAKKAEKTKKREVTLLQERFCYNLVRGMLAKDAIVKAGSKAKYPDSMASQLLKNTQVAARLKEMRVELGERMMIDAEKVLGAFAEIGFLDPAQMLDVDDNILQVREMPLSVRRAIAGFDVEELYEGTGKDRKYIGRIKKLRFCNKNDALEKMARHLGLFEKDNLQRQGKTIVEILALVANARRKRVQNTYSPEKLEP